MYLSVVISSVTKSLEVSDMICIECGSTEFAIREICISFDSERLVFIASLPPLKITLFPDFMQSAEASVVTFGLDS